MTLVNLIVATCGKNRGIGKNGQLPWRLPREMKNFAKLTTSTLDTTMQNAVIMGRKTWESIPSKFRPLKGRFNVVLSGNKDFDSKTTSACATCCSSFEEAMDLLVRKEGIELIWVIGGSSVYQAAMKSPFCHRIYVTEIEPDFDCDVFFPEISQDFYRVEDQNLPQEVQIEGDVKYRYTVYEKTA